MTESSPHNFVELVNAKFPHVIKLYEAIIPKPSGEIFNLNAGGPAHLSGWLAEARIIFNFCQHPQAGSIFERVVSSVVAQSPSISPLGVTCLVLDSHTNFLDPQKRAEARRVLWTSFHNRYVYDLTLWLMLPYADIPEVNVVAAAISQKASPTHQQLQSIVERFNRPDIPALPAADSGWWNRKMVLPEYRPNPPDLGAWRSVLLSKPEHLHPEVSEFLKSLVEYADPTPLYDLLVRLAQGERKSSTRSREIANCYVRYTEGDRNNNLRLRSHFPLISYLLALYYFPSYPKARDVVVCCGLQKDRSTTRSGLGKYVFEAAPSRYGAYAKFAAWREIYLIAKHKHIPLFPSQYQSLEGVYLGLNNQEISQKYNLPLRSISTYIDTAIERVRKEEWGATNKAFVITRPFLPEWYNSQVEPYFLTFAAERD